MDRFVDPSVPLGGGRLPDPVTEPGRVVYGATDFTAADSRGFLGAADPAFAGVPLAAGSPLECNRKASQLALDYNVFARRKFADDQYTAKYANYVNRCKTECNCFARACDDAMKAGQFVDDPGLCTQYPGSSWRYGTPIKPTKPPSLDSFYSTQEIGRYLMLAEQTATLAGGEYGVAVDGTGQPAVTDLAWTFFANAADAPFGMQCRVHLRECSRVAASADAISGVTITDTQGLSDLGLRTLATVPYLRPDCARSPLSRYPTAAECTELAAERTTDSIGLKWFDTLPDEGNVGSKTSEMNRICRVFPGLHECLCLNRETNATYQEAQIFFKTTSPVCWYIPCQVSGFDRLITPKEVDARNACQANVCQNIVSVIDSSSVSVDDLKATINCTSAEWEGATGGGGGGGGGGGVISGITDGVAQAVTDYGAIAGLVVGLLVALALLAYAARLWFGTAPAAT